MQTAISHLHLLPLIRQISRNDLSGQYCISSAQENWQMLDKDYKIITRITHDSSSHLSKQPYNYALHRVEQRQRRRPNSRPAKTRLCDRSNYSKIANLAWLGSRVVSVRRRRAWVQIALATLSSNSHRQTVHTHCASVHQAAKMVAALGCEGNCRPGGK